MKIRYLVIIICFLMLGCFNSETSKDPIEILYFKADILTPIQVTCNTIYGYYGLRKIELKEKKEIDIFKEKLQELEDSNSYEGIDVRYKLTYLNDTICMDVLGGIIHNGNRMKDSPKMLDYVKELIDKYKEYALKREGEIEIED
jgi:hypothetical protein